MIGAVAGPSPPWQWPAPETDRGAWHLTVAFPMPDVDLPATSGATRSAAATLSVGATRGLSVLFVYPWTGGPGLTNPPGWDDIPGAHGSTPEAEGFRDDHAWFTSRNITVLGLSGQSPEHQRELSQRLGLPYPILSDADLVFADAANLPRFAAGGITYLKRLTLVLWNGRVVARFYPVHPPDRHAAEVRGWLQREMGL